MVWYIDSDQELLYSVCGGNTQVEKRSHLKNRFLNLAQYCYNNNNNIVMHYIIVRHCLGGLLNHIETD